MVKVKLVGAGGYGGVGAAEIFSRHPEAELVALVDVADIGAKLSDLYPHLAGVCDLEIVDAEHDAVEADAVFFATPDRVGMRLASGYIDRGCKVVDYSGDFRFDNEASYADYASRIDLETTHLAPDLLSKSAYGLSELHRAEIAKATVVGNPGCFAVSAILGAAPAVRDGIIDFNRLVFDAKTGVSGAGKKPNAVFHFPHRYEEMNAYKICKHQHVMEVERELSLLAGKEIAITLNTQVVPVVRGIMTSIYAPLATGVDTAKAVESYREFYRDEPFVIVSDGSGSAGNRTIRGTNRCHLWVNVDSRTNTLVVMSHIDNLMKGQAGSAVQNLNILFELEETAGLDTPGMYP